MFAILADRETRNCEKLRYGGFAKVEIHTKVGEQCIGAKVNLKLVPLSYELKSGDQIEILTVRYLAIKSKEHLHNSIKKLPKCAKNNVKY